MITDGRRRAQSCLTWPWVPRTRARSGGTGGWWPPRPPPSLLRAGKTPGGRPASLFEGFIQTATADTPAWMKGFLDNFYNMDVLGGTLVSDQAFQASFNLATA